MRLLVLLLVLASAAGCSAHTYTRLNTGSTTSASQGSASVDVQVHSSGLAAAILAASVLAGAIEWSKEDRAFPNPATLFSPAPPPAPALAPQRSVSEQDCTRPLQNTGGNLRCR